MLLLFIPVDSESDNIKFAGKCKLFIVYYNAHVKMKSMSDV